MVVAVLDALRPHHWNFLEGRVSTLTQGRKVSQTWSYKGNQSRNRVFFRSHSPSLIWSSLTRVSLVTRSGGGFVDSKNSHVLPLSPSYHIEADFGKRWIVRRINLLILDGISTFVPSLRPLKIW
jgi:hypothetical protein